MVQRQLIPRGIGDPRVLDAMGRVPRHEFVPLDIVDYAYDDRPLPLSDGQTISQPYIVALMVESARIGPDDVVLDVGHRLGLRGSGGGGTGRPRLQHRTPAAPRRERRDTVCADSATASR